MQIARVALVVLGLVLANAAHATPVQRTFVASTGLDTNACSASAPCRTFAAAQGQTNSGGEIIVLDSAGYGSMTITKSLSIVAAEGAYAGVSVPSGTGIYIGAAGVDVMLKGLTINGQGGSTGIYMASGNSLTVVDCAINNFTVYGIFVGSPSSVTIERTTLDRDYSGIYFGAGAQGTVSNVSIRNSSWVGLWAVASSQTRDTVVQVSDSLINGAKWSLVANSSDATYRADIQATRVQVHGATDIGVDAEYQNGRINLSECVITHNGVGVRAFSGGTIDTLQDNVVIHNSSNSDASTGSINAYSKS